MILKKGFWYSAFFLLVFCAKNEQVVEVIDGDTFKTKQGKTVRLLGVNAPEMTEPGGDIAKDWLTLILLNHGVRLEKDVTQKDDYGRYLYYVYLDNTFVNAEIVRLGYAEVRSYPPDTMHQRQLEESEKIAIRNKKGLWSFAVFQAPDTSRYREDRLPEKYLETEIIMWQDAADYYGQTKTVEGRIVVSNNTGKVCFLNFHKDWSKYFTAVIFSSDFNKFPANPEDYYLNRKVRVTGLIKEYKEKPEIIVKSPSQIEIIE